ncbi:hypothetical protein DFH11DRAFT_1543018 [Phellopilus nigrolimitatus]|nr:hypothetical protein DFH11DRAFT_1543018 [Phellopilus nigrolimitatus]
MLQVPPATLHRLLGMLLVLPEATDGAAWTTEDAAGPPKTLQDRRRRIRVIEAADDAGSSRRLSETLRGLSQSPPDALKRLPWTQTSHRGRRRVKDGLGTIKEAAGAESTVEKAPHEQSQHREGHRNGRSIELDHQRIDIDLILKDVRVLFDGMLRSSIVRATHDGMNSSLYTLLGLDGLRNVHRMYGECLRRQAHGRWEITARVMEHALEATATREENEAKAALEFRGTMGDMGSGAMEGADNMIIRLALLVSAVESVRGTSGVARI